MTRNFRRLMRQQIQEHTDKFLGLTKRQIPKSGWIRAIRESLGISSYNLSKL